MTASKNPSIAKWMAILLCIFLVLFPKGGVKVGNVPITWGYVLIALTVLFAAPYRFLVLRARFFPQQVVAIACFAPFWIVFFFIILAYGVGGAVGGFVSTGTSLVFLPLAFVWFYPPLIEDLDGNQLMRTVAGCMFIAAIFGIFLFIWAPITGNFLTVPYLTVNADDLADLGGTKNIARGFLFKLISTYNNGNVYGAATLILMSLYDEFMPQAWKRWLLRVALMLTLSRTVWAGLVFDQLLAIGAVFLRQFNHFPRLKLGKAATTALLLITLVPVFVAVVQLAGFKNGFLTDPTLGGRAGQFQHLGDNPIIPDQTGPLAFAEIVYVSAISSFGYVGSVAIVLFFASPLLVLAIDRSAIDDPIRRAALKGLLTYALICTSDGAINLIPVMVFYSFAYMLFIFGLPGSRKLTARAKPGNQWLGVPSSPSGASV